MTRFLVIENLKPGGSPWWFKHLPSPIGLRFDAECVHETSARAALPNLLRAFWKARHYDVVITNQDGYATFLFATLRSISGRVYPRGKRPVHVVMEFITKPRNGSFYSRAKYRFMSVALRSVDRFICSAKREAELYASELALPPERFVHLPLMTDPKFLTWEQRYTSPSPHDGYVVASGFTGRDFKTLLDAVANLDVPVRVITSPRALEGLTIPSNVETIFNLPFSEHIDQLARARIVVVPLKNWEISVGQSVILQAMALARPVIATRVPGTVGYIHSEQNGLLVEPGSSDALREALARLLDDEAFAERLAAAGRVSVESHSTPYAVIPRIDELIDDLRASSSQLP